MSAFIPVNIPALEYLFISVPASLFSSILKSIFYSVQKSILMQINDYLFVYQSHWVYMDGYAIPFSYSLPADGLNCADLHN